jgi:hypothetical protein
MRKHIFEKTMVISTVTLLVIISIIPYTRSNAGLAAIEHNEPFYSSTETDITPPKITINFAGNLSDRGGPYWRPPEESDPLMGVWSDGYYTNDSRQQENWIYINLTVTDDTEVGEVWLHWKNETVWINQSYQLSNMGGDFWEFNSSGNITPIEGCQYSFDIWAADTAGNVEQVWWSKTGLGGVFTRRYIQLHCTPTNITYSPYYCYTLTYTHSGQDTYSKDRLHHDQGPDGTVDDTGCLLADLPTNVVHERHCGAFVGYWFDESVCFKPFTLINIYQHFWWGNLTPHNDPKQSTDDTVAAIGWSKSKGELPVNAFDVYLTDSYETSSHLMYRNKPYHLKTKLITLTTPTVLTDNNIYELIPLHISTENPSCISNRSFVSFILLNVPDNETLNTSYIDSDSDGLSDWTELYVTYTSPFLSDTDNDCVSDYYETRSGSDPNNYTDSLFSFICGDCNNDEIVNIADVGYLINYLLKNGPDPQPLVCVGNCNNDDVVDIGDVVYLINYLFRDEPTPTGCCG